MNSSYPSWGLPRTRPTLLESGKKSEVKANKESGLCRATEPRPSHDRTTTEPRWVGQLWDFLKAGGFLYGFVNCKMLEKRIMEEFFLYNVYMFINI